MPNTATPTPARQTTLTAINTKDLAGAALSWAVAQAEGHGCAVIKSTIGLEPYVVIKADILGMYAPHSNPAQGHPIIEREGIETAPTYEQDSDTAKRTGWMAIMLNDERCVCGAFMAEGPTALIAAMRCHVLNRLGPTVDVPQELLP